MATEHLLYKRLIPVNDKISVVVPTVGEILDNEDEYYGLVTAFTAMPMDFFVVLEENGIDMDSINAFDLFIFLFLRGVKDQDASMVLTGVNFANLTLGVNEKNGNPVLVDYENDVIIDRGVHTYIANVLRKIHYLKKNNKRPANKETRDYLIERAKIKRARNKDKRQSSALEDLIVSLVNTEEYKYDYETTKALSIYQFNSSARQIRKKIDYNNRMTGVYAGTVDSSKLDPEDLTWIVSSNMKEEK